MSEIADRVKAVLDDHTVMVTFDHEPPTAITICSCGFKDTLMSTEPNEHLAEQIATVAALELVRLREGIGRLASEWERAADSIAITYQDAAERALATGPTRGLIARLRALLDDNQGDS